MRKPIRLTIFIIVSLLCSFAVLNPLEYSYFKIENKNIPFLLLLLSALLIPMGLMLSSLFLRTKLKIENKITFFGQNPKCCCLLLILPVLCLSIVGMHNNHGINPHLLGFFFGLVIMIYVLMEEYGWRGYLQEELAISNEWLRAIIIGAIWYLWHWSFVSNPDVKSNLIFLAVMIAGSLAIGKIADTTKSIAICGFAHAMGSISFTSPLIVNSIPLTKRLIIVSVCVITLIFMDKKWGLFSNK
tara:strand:- start:32 stop:760 length:729 start_codon:yes stop_codon:yes gene_type:complete